MKTLYLSCACILIAFSVHSQVARAARVSLTQVSGEDRLAIVRESIEVTEWHQDSFWKQYEQYLTNDQEVTGTAYNALLSLADIKDMQRGEVSYATGLDIIRYKHEQLGLWQNYHAQISAAHNGIIGLQFLQTEVLLDILESSRIYEQTSLGKYRSHPILDSITHKPVDIHKVLVDALYLQDDEAVPFFTVYDNYQHEREVLLGDNYDQIAAYASDPSDYSPAQAKTAGANLLEVIRREIRLKEKYFKEMNLRAGPSVAAKFLAWEDYYSLICKMDAWTK